MTQTTQPSGNTQAARPAQREATEDFATLRARFDASGCGAEAYTIATWMFARFPDEARQMLPLIHDDALKCDPNSAHNATNHQWAAALVGAKKTLLDRGLRQVTTGELATITEAQAHENIRRIYAENHHGAAACPAR